MPNDSYCHIIIIIQNCAVMVWTWTANAFIQTYQPRGRPSANAANSYLEFTACKSQKFGHWANNQPLLEKAKKLTIFIGNSAPLRTFFLKNLEKFDYRFFRKQNYLVAPFELPGWKSAGCSPVLYETNWEGEVHCRECSCRHCYKVLGKTLRLTLEQKTFYE